ncbi:hypothetical protein E2C01_049340 [Portunus trituberculatus]|uniref:Uncharacterized protein n=1 Tax=Portunus trituberculatus TaxID=210409 RepID=A0A5B7GDF7_PORTR|nr:hypothetical protein [Portunus trituberculatus]
MVSGLRLNQCRGTEEIKGKRSKEDSDTPHNPAGNVTTISKVRPSDRRSGNLIEPPVTPTTSLTRRPPLHSLSQISRRPLLSTHRQHHPRHRHLKRRMKKGEQKEDVGKRRGK